MHRDEGGRGPHVPPGSADDPADGAPAATTGADGADGRADPGPSGAPVSLPVLVGSAVAVAAVVLLLAGSSTAIGLVAAAAVEVGVVVILYRWSARA